ESSSTEVVTVQEALDALEASYARPKAMAAPRPAVALEIDDHELLELARNAKNGALFRQLYDQGDTSRYQHEDGTTDDSGAEMGLCNLLAFWCAGDEVRMDRLFRGSALMRDKWERADYRERTLNKAILGQTAFYEPSISVQVKQPTLRVVEGGRNGNHPQEGRASVVNVVSVVTSSRIPEAPKNLEPEALYGLAGDVVRAIEPHTEAHPAALLFSFLTRAGCTFGPKAHVYRDGGRHAGNEFTCLVGTSGVSRKGTAGRRIEEVFKYGEDHQYKKNNTINCNWTILSTCHGLGSGESLVASLCDEEGALGADDLRRLVMEEEFSKVLKVMRREGSTLSENLRSAWDAGVLASRTKGKKMEARGAHVSVMGHITLDELKIELGQSALWNGFANRFLWVCTQRAHLLPRGGGKAPIASSVYQLHEVLKIARMVEEVDFDDQVHEMWDGGGLYALLTERPSGLFGAVTSRAECHVTRLALIYCLLDKEQVIRRPHLLAALACWEYSEQSCRYIFGSATGNEYADQIEEWLREVYPGYLTRQEIRDKFLRNAPAGRIADGLDLLESSERAMRSKLETKGRPAEIWTWNQLRRNDLNDGNDGSPLKRARQLV
ncbi:MAG: DUF3987 domain-containing protein, partial [Blastocatellia bacterium]|nr:DUF3987 domain-containing protein [Blastocatellia bacterium]